MSISPGGSSPYRPPVSTGPSVSPRPIKPAATTPPLRSTLPEGARCDSKSPLTISASLSGELKAFLTEKLISSLEDCVPGTQKDLITFLDKHLPKEPLGNPIAKMLSDFLSKSCSFKTTQVDDLPIMSRCLWLSGDNPITVTTNHEVDSLTIEMLGEKIKTCLSTAAEADRAGILTDLHTSLHESHRDLIPDKLE
jgi:hypothetical protein